MENVRREVGPESSLQHGLMCAGSKVDRGVCHAAILKRPRERWQPERCYQRACRDVAALSSAACLKTGRHRPVLGQPSIHNPALVKSVGTSPG